MKKAPDLTEHLSDACVRSMLAALALAALALGICDKLSAVPAFGAYAKVQIAWSNLRAQLDFLLADDCWLAYQRSLSAGSDPLATTLADLKTVKCRYAAGNGTGMHLSLVAGAHELGTDGNVPRKVVAALTQRSAPSPSPRARLTDRPRALPMAPMIVEVSSTGPIAAVQMLQETLGTLWNDKLLAEALEYNNATAKEDIYWWQVIKAQIDQQLQFETSHRYDFVEPFGNLRLKDIKALAAIRHPPITSLDEAIQESFRASLPDRPLSVDLTTAAFATAIGIAAFMIVLAAYIRAGIRNDAHLVPGTIFHALLGSTPFEIFAIAMLLVPPTSELYLLVATFKLPSSHAYLIVGPIAGGAVAAFVAIVLRLWPYMAIRALLGRRS